MSADKAKKRGRPATTETKKLSKFLAQQITKNSGLSATTLEELMHMKNGGANWRNYLRGERSMSAETRTRVAKIALARGWLSQPKRLPPAGDMTQRSHGWVLEGRQLEDVESRIQRMVETDQNIANKKMKAIKALKALADAVQIPLKYDHLHVNHRAYTEAKTDYNDDGSIEAQYTGLKNSHGDKFVQDLEEMIDKVDGVGTFYSHFIDEENPN
jgi:hypothetical protein